MKIGMEDLGDSKRDFWVLQRTSEVEGLGTCNIISNYMSEGKVSLFSDTELSPALTLNNDTWAFLESCDSQVE